MELSLKRVSAYVRWIFCYVGKELSYLVELETFIKSDIISNFIRPSAQAHPLLPGLCAIDYPLSFHLRS